MRKLLVSMVMAASFRSRGEHRDRCASQGAIRFSDDGRRSNSEHVSGKTIVLADVLRPAALQKVAQVLTKVQTEYRKGRKVFGAAFVGAAGVSSIHQIAGDEFPVGYRAGPGLEFLAAPCL